MPRFCISATFSNRRQMKILFRFLIVLFLFTISSHLIAQKHAYEAEIAAYKKQDQAKKPAPGQILFVGSSSFRLWDSLPAYFPGFQIINRGFGGSTLKDVIYYADDIIFPYQPKQVVIYCGENDLVEPNVDAAVVTDRFKILFDLIRKHDPGVPVLFVAIKPSPSRRLHREAVEAANAAIKYFLSQQLKSSFVDVYHPMLESDGRVKSAIFRSDSLHMNAKGYHIWTREITPYLIK